jgi:predicted acylesterase/phospholipase RssA/CRP-like cAMP-binding protein
VEAVLTADSAPAASASHRRRMLAERPILRGLDPRVLSDLDSAFELVRVPRGARIVARGQSGVPFFLILEGGVRASYVDATGRRRVVFEHFRGGSFGEALVLTQLPSPLDVDAIRDCLLLALAPEKFCAIAARHPEFVLTFARFVAERVVKHYDSPEVLAAFAGSADRLPRSIAVLSAGGPELQRTRDLLAQALSASRDTRRVTADDARHAPSGASGTDEDDAYWRYAKWLSDLDVRSDLLLLEGDCSNATWRDFCLRQADRLVILLQGDASVPSPGAQLDWWRGAKISELATHVEVAIVHPGYTVRPHAGVACARLPGVARIHHIKDGDAHGAQRLARWLLDRPVGLVLGGGGAYGIAHVGVLKALEEARVSVDIVGGTSMGAIFAGGVARGWSADEIMDHVRNLFSSRFALYDPTLPFSALLAGKKLQRVLRGLFEDIDIADLWLPFFCVSTNISRAQRQVHDEGPLYDAIRASCSIPGLFPPHESLQQWLVDGGLVGNLPIDVMAERCRGPMIAVDVFPYRRRREETERHARRRFDLREKFKQWAKSRPYLFDVLMHATLVGSQHSTEVALSEHRLALYLEPELERFRILDWRAYESLFQAGYVCAKRALDAGALQRSLWEGPA